MKSKVWIVKEQVRQSALGPTVMNFVPAMRYGDIQFITRTDLPLYPNSDVAAVWEDDVRKFVNEYNPDTDYIVATGQPTSIFAVGYALAKSGKRPRFLVWRREDDRYMEFQPEYPQ